MYLSYVQRASPNSKWLLSNPLPKSSVGMYSLTWLCYLKCGAHSRNLTSQPLRHLVSHIRRASAPHKHPTPKPRPPHGDVRSAVSFLEFKIQNSNCRPLELAGEEKFSLKFEIPRRNRNVKFVRVVMHPHADLCEVEWLLQGVLRKVSNAAPV